VARWASKTLMHIELAKEIVKTCRQREREGDHPTVEVPPTELLESCVIELAARLGIEAPEPPVFTA
jgi:hypothetical protein